MHPQHLCRRISTQHAFHHWPTGLVALSIPTRPVVDLGFPDQGEGQPQNLASLAVRESLPKKAVKNTRNRGGEGCRFYGVRKKVQYGSPSWSGKAAIRGCSLQVPGCSRTHLPHRTSCLLHLYVVAHRELCPCPDGSVVVLLLLLAAAAAALVRGFRALFLCRKYCAPSPRPPRQQGTTARAVMIAPFLGLARARMPSET